MILDKDILLEKTTELSCKFMSRFDAYICTLRFSMESCNPTSPQTMMYKLLCTYIRPVVFCGITIHLRKAVKRLHRDKRSMEKKCDLCIATMSREMFQF